MRRFAVLVLCAACGGDKPAAAPRGKPVVFVVNYPLAYFAERIGGARIDVGFPVPPGEDPAFWDPPDDVVVRYQAADLILLNGAGYAKWVPRVSLPDARCVTTFSGTPIREEGAVAHAHGPGGAHDHGGSAFTTWLDFAAAAAQARAVRDALKRLVPAHAAEFDARCFRVEKELKLLDAKLITEAPKGPLVGSHPVYQYLARRYGLNLKSVHWEPGEAPDAKGWQELNVILKDHPAKTMLWEGAPHETTAARLKDLGIRCIVFDPCGRRPPAGDLLAVLRANVAALTPR